MTLSNQMKFRLAEREYEQIIILFVVSWSFWGNMIVRLNYCLISQQGYRKSLNIFLFFVACL